MRGERVLAKSAKTTNPARQRGARNHDRNAGVRCSEIDDHNSNVPCLRVALRVRADGAALARGARDLKDFGSHVCVRVVLLCVCVVPATWSDDAPRHACPVQ